MKLLNIYLYDLKNSGHYEFVHSIVEFALQCQGVLNHLAKWFAPFKAAVEEEDRLMQISLKNVISEQLAKLDGQRDGLVSSIHGATNAMLKSLDSEVVAAANRVMNELISLKVDIQDNYMNQTGQIDMLVTVLLGKYEADLQKLELLGMVQTLKDVNDQMHTLMNQRDKEQYDRMNDSLAKARLVTDAAYKDFACSFESYTFLYADELESNDEGLIQFGNDVNARIEYFRRNVLKVNSVPEYEVPGGGGSETNPSKPDKPTEPSLFTALFTFHGGRTEEITAAAGATLTAPTNTEGYMWQPTVPAVMPAENTSYTEEEDNRQEYQITYMDANNEDEFDIQMVKEGDPIVPPTPPTGYHWVDVPEVMPARNIYIRCAANA